MEQFILHMDDFLAAQRFRIKIVAETERGDPIMTQYVPGLYRWGDDVAIKVKLEAKVA